MFDFLNNNSEAIAAILTIVIGLVVDGLKGYSDKTPYIGLIKRIAGLVVKIVGLVVKKKSG